MLLSDEKNINILEYDGKYLGQSEKVTKVLYSTFKNKYIIKGSTGIGGTTAIFNYTLGNFIIISPNVQMIRSKEDKKNKQPGCFKSKKQFFFYGECKDSWDDVFRYLTEEENQNVIINATPNQILKVSDELYKLLIQIPVFVDEMHLFSEEPSFRKEVAEFSTLLFNEWVAKFTLSTATPFLNLWDIPNHIEMDYYLVKKTNQPKKHIQLSHDKKAIDQFVIEQNELGRMVVIFSNNINIHKGFKDFNVVNIVGKDLEAKLKSTGRLTTVQELEDSNFSGVDILIASSSFFTGFDLEKDCSILIISDQHSDAKSINVNSVVQAYGRCRTTVHDALLVNVLPSDKFISSRKLVIPKSVKELEIYYNDYLNKIAKYSNLSDNLTHNENFVRGKYVNEFKLMLELQIAVSNYQLFDDNVLRETLEEYNFIVTNYESENEKLLKKLGLTFEQRIKNLLKEDEKQLRLDYYNIKNKLRNKDDGTFSPSLVLEYLTTYLLKITNATGLISKLNNKRVYKGEFYQSFNSFLSVNAVNKNLLIPFSEKQLNANRGYENESIKQILSKLAHLTDDWQMLYAISKLNGIRANDNSVDRNFNIIQISSDTSIYEEYLNSGSNRNSSTFKAIQTELKKLKITLSKSEIDYFKKLIVNNYGKLVKGNSIISMDDKYLKRLAKEAIIYCLTNGKCGRGKQVGYREYNPLTALPRALRRLIPIKYLEVDLASANAQFIDIILDTNLADKIYDNLKKKLGISRNQAKWKFNSTLNNSYLSIKEAKEFYILAGYPNRKAEQLAKLTAQVEKGSFFKKMTEYEQCFIDLYREKLTLNTFRFHDAFIVKEADIINNKLVLSKEILTPKLDKEVFFNPDFDLEENKKIQFHIKYYNTSNLVYRGPVSSIPIADNERLKSAEKAYKIAS